MTIPPPRLGSISCTVTISSGDWVAVGIELRTVNPLDPLLVQAKGTSTNSGSNGNGFVYSLPQAALAGNAIICGITYEYSSSRTMSIADNESDAWQTAIAFTDSTPGQDSHAIVFANNVTAGAQRITFTFDEPVQDFQAACKEAYNIDTSASPLDGISSASSVTGPIISSGSITTTADGDLIFQYGGWYNTNATTLNVASQAMIGFAAGSGWSTIIANTMDGQFFQDIRQATAGVITPSYDEEEIPGALDSNTWSTIAAAFKTSSSAGTAPPSSGIHIDHEDTVVIAAGNNITPQIAADGNFLTAVMTDTTDSFTTNDSQQNSYTLDSPGSQGYLFYATAPIVNVTQKLYVTDTGGGNDEIVMRDIRGVATISPIDTTGNNEGLQSVFTAGTTITTAPTITPSAANELVIFSLEDGCGPPQDISSPSGVITDSIYYTAQLDNDTFDEGEGHGHFFTTGNTQFSGTWVMQNTSCGGNAWGAAAWAIQPGSTTPSLSVPTFSPAAGSYTAGQSITMSQSSGATICYNTTGSPSCTNAGTCGSSSTTYTGPVNVASSETLYAIATEVNYTNSSVGSATYTIGSSPILATPTYSPGAGTYAGTQSVTISAPSGATICYNTTGSPTAPTAGTCGSSSTTYTGPVNVASSETLYAVATEVNYTNSSDGSATYTIGSSPILATPTYSPGAGTYAGTQSVTISAPSGATICYNTTGGPTAPTAGTCGSSSTTYTGPVNVASSETLYAIATEVNYTNSSVGSATYTIGSSPILSTLSPTSGPGSTSVTITGTGFGSTRGSSTVRFNGTTATSITSWGATSIVALVPTGATTGEVVVTVSGVASNGVSFTVTLGVTKLTPNSGATGATVVITGFGFGSTQGNSMVTFNGTTATPSSWSATSITVKVPVGATTGNVVVTVGSVASNGITFTATPSRRHF